MPTADCTVSLSWTITIMSHSNGSRLGREFSANALNLWFNDPTAKPQVQQQPRQLQGQQSQGQQSPPPGGGQQTSEQSQPNQPQQQPRQKPSHSDDFDYSPVLPGLELFQTGPDSTLRKKPSHVVRVKRKEERTRSLIKEA